MHRNKIAFSISGIITIIFMNACGPSQAEIDATTTQAAEARFATQTAEAPKATPIPTNTPIPTSTPTPTPMPTETPGPTTGFVSGTVFWVDTGTPVEGIQLIFGEGITVTTLDDGIITDAQGRYSAIVNPVSFSTTLNWQFVDQDIPCSSLNFTLLGGWNVFPLIKLNTGGYLLTAFGPKLSVEAGDEIEPDIQFTCQ